MKKRVILVFISLLSCLLMQAQEFNFPMTSLPMSDWQLSTTKWNKAKAIEINPFDAKKTKISAGEGLLLASGNAGTIVSMTQVKDVKLKFEFLLGEASESVFSIGNFGILLRNSWGKEDINPCGSILTETGVQLPFQNVCLASGLWQQIEITFSAAQGKQAAVVEQIKLNGVIIHQAVVLNHQSKETSYPLSFENKMGILAIRNFEYLSLSNERPLTLSDLTYKVYEAWQWENVDENKPKESGKTDVLTQEYGSAYKNYCILYQGAMQVAKTGTYLFSADFSGTFSFKIDGKELINQQLIYRIPQNVSLELSAGTHTFELRYAKAWWKAGLGLFVTTAGIRPYPLHAPSSLPEPDAVGEIAVNPKENVEIVRSFILFDDKKRTHAISVGSPEGIHYSFDLDEAALLYVWKGRFADVTDMWYERGEPQLLKPLGTVIKLSGKPTLALLNDENAAFPDSLDAFTALKYKEYSLDKQGYPTYTYELDDISFTQKIIPQAKGLNESIEVKGDSKRVFCKLDEGKTIQQIDKNLYLVDNHYIEVSDKTKVNIRSTAKGSELIAAVKNSISYSIIW